MAKYSKEALKNYRWRQKALIDGLKNVPCTDCGGVFPAVCMDFDHVRGQKKYNVSMMHGRSFKAIMDEIDKCEIVCSNCHRIRTQKRIKA